MDPLAQAVTSSVPMWPSRKAFVDAFFVANQESCGGVRHGVFFQQFYRSTGGGSNFRMTCLKARCSFCVAFVRQGPRGPYKFNVTQSKPHTCGADYVIPVPSPQPDKNHASQPATATGRTASTATTSTAITASTAATVTGRTASTATTSTAITASTAATATGRTVTTASRSSRAITTTASTSSTTTASTASTTTASTASTAATVTGRTASTATTSTAITARQPQPPPAAQSPQPARSVEPLPPPPAPRAQPPPAPPAQPRKHRQQPGCPPQKRLIMYDPCNERRAVKIKIPKFASGVRGYVDNVRQGRYDNDCPDSAEVKLVRSTLKLGSRERHALHKFVEDSSGLTSCYSAPNGGNEYRECSAFMGIRGAGVAKPDVAEENLGTKPRYAGKYKGSLEATGTVRRNARSAACTLLGCALRGDATLAPELALQRSRDLARRPCLAAVSGRIQVGDVGYDAIAFEVPSSTSSTSHPVIHYDKRDKTRAVMSVVARHAPEDPSKVLRYLVLFLPDMVVVPMRDGDVAIFNARFYHFGVEATGAPDVVMLDASTLDARRALLVAFLVVRRALGINHIPRMLAVMIAAAVAHGRKLCKTGAKSARRKALKLEATTRGEAHPDAYHRLTIDEETLLSLSQVPTRLDFYKLLGRAPIDVRCGTSRRITELFFDHSDYRPSVKVLDEVSRHETVVCAAEAYKLFDPPFVWVPVNKNVGER
ncbi:hypothetical protein RI054_26g107970 [Pseudoscourfieldia marina]